MPIDRRPSRPAPGPAPRPLPRRPHPAELDDDGPLHDPGRGLGLRLLALLGAFSFLMLGLSSIAPLLQPPPAPERLNQSRPPTG